MRYNRCTAELRRTLISVFDQSSAVTYHVLDVAGCLTVSPCTSLETNEATQQAMETIERDGLNGAKSHLHGAAENIKAAKCADSVRDIIHAKDAVARTIDPKAGTPGETLSNLGEKEILEHSAIEQAFGKLYGYTSDEKGICHSMTEEGAPDVGLDEEMFMFSACAASTAYLIRKRADAGRG